MPKGALGQQPSGDASCPCGTGRSYAACCRPLLTGERLAGTVEELMRSRYAAFALRDVDHLVRTWHPRTRPDPLELDPAVEWVGLEVVRVEGGGAEDETGVVEFVARWRRPRATGRQHEVSRFARRAGRWVYVDGEHV